MTRPITVPSTTETRTMETIIIKRFRPIRFARINARITHKSAKQWLAKQRERDRERL